MKLKPFLLLFAVMLAPGGAAAAQQIRFENSMFVTASGGTGYQNPGFLYRGGLEAEGKRLLLRGQGGIGLAQKRETGDGWIRRFRADGYLKAGRLLVGGGATGAKQTTSRWSKSSIHPLVGGGVEHKNFRLLAGYLMKGTDELNGVTGIDLQSRIQVSRRFAINPEVTVTRFYSTGRPDLPRKVGVSAAMGFTFSFGRTMEVPR
jgi:hypothetical protein